MGFKDRLKGWMGRKPNPMRDGEDNSPLPDKKLIEDCETTLSGLVKSIPFEENDQAVKLLVAITNGKVLSRSKEHLVYDAPNAGVQDHYMISPRNMRVLEKSYIDACNSNPYLKFTAHAERAWSNVVIKEFKEYVKRCDDAGCSFIALTGKDIESLFHALDFSKDFIWGKEEHKETCDYMSRLKDLYYDVETIVFINMDAIISDIALNTLIKELSKNIYVLGMEGIVRKYQTVEFENVSRFNSMGKAEQG